MSRRDHPYARGGYSGRGGSDRGPPRYDPYPSRHNETKSEAPAKEKPTRTLFVRNISYDYSPDEIEQMFAKYGQIKKFFNLISKRGMAFITYVSIETEPFNFISIF
jgi:RNA recognition motif-containing protein